VAEVIKFDTIMSIFVTWDPHWTTFINDFLSNSDVSFARSKVSGAAEVIECEVAMSIFVTLGLRLTTFINKTFFRIFAHLLDLEWPEWPK
jgi:hypothetical protein